MALLPPRLEDQVAEQQGHADRGGHAKNLSHWTNWENRR
jgi:hypothetical protein